MVIRLICLPPYGATSTAIVHPSSPCGLAIESLDKGLIDRHAGLVLVSLVKVEVSRRTRSYGTEEMLGIDFSDTRHGQLVHWMCRLAIGLMGRTCGDEGADE